MKGALLAAITAADGRNEAKKRSYVTANGVVPKFPANPIDWKLRLTTGPRDDTPYGSFSTDHQKLVRSLGDEFEAKFDSSGQAMH